MRRCLYLVPLLLCLAPSPALAGGIPLFPEGWLPATVIISVTILLEGVLLRWRIKQVRFMGTLWRSGILNVASRSTGWLLLLGLAQCASSVQEGGILLLLISLFFVALVTEIPLLRLLYKQVPVTWERAWTLGLGINLASCAVACVLYPIVWIAYQGHLDEVELARWTNPELLNQTSGLIYAAHSDGQSYRLRVFDVQEGAWRSLANSPPLDPRGWDVEGHICAYSCRQAAREEKLAIASLPRFETLHEISVSALAGEESDWRGVADLSVSPDAKKLAFLWHVADAAAQRDASSYYVLGKKCRLVVLDVGSGREITRATRWASADGLCWLPDSDTVLFVSFRDETLYDTTKGDVSGGFGRGLRDLPESVAGRFARGLYAFNTVTGEIAWFSEGEFPSASAMAKRIAVCDEGAVRVLDAQARELACLPYLGLRRSRALLSPSGRFLLVEIGRRVGITYHGGFLTVIDVNDTTKRHVLEETWVDYPRRTWEVAEPPND